MCSVGTVMTTNRTKSKLGLHRETLVELDASALARANGGFKPLSGDRICPTDPRTMQHNCTEQP